MIAFWSRISRKCGASLPSLSCRVDVGGVIPRLLLLVLFLSAARIGVASSQQEFYERLQHIGTPELLKMGQAYLDGAHPDSALTCFTWASNRHFSHPTPKEKELRIRAYLGRWLTYFFYFFDYSKAYESLTAAEELAKDSPEMLPRIYLDYGAMYQTLYEQGNDNARGKLAFQYYLKSYKLTINERSEAADMAFSNLVTMGYGLGRMGELKGDFRSYLHHHSPDQRLQAYVIQLYEGYLDMSRHDYAAAEQGFKRLLSTIPLGWRGVRHLYVAYTLIAKAQSLQGHHREALASLLRAKAVAEKQTVKDARLEVYGLIGEQYRLLGQTEEAEAYRNKYFRVKDTLLNYQQLMGVNEMKLMRQMKKADEQMKRNEQRRQQLMVVVYAVSIVAVIILISLWIVLRNSRKLRRSYVYLYRKNQSLIQSEVQAREERMRLEQQLDEREKKSSAETSAKYGTSALEEGHKDLIVKRIEEVVQNNEAIYSPDFTSVELTQLVGGNYRYISQVIHERFNCNLPTFINEARIKEACRRISDTQHYGRMTIEGIGASVGFRARSSFINAFKRFTGLTPSEYMKIASSQGSQSSRVLD